METKQKTPFNDPRWIATHGADVDKAISEFDKSSPFNWQIQISDIVKDKLDQFLVFLCRDKYK